MKGYRKAGKYLADYVEDILACDGPSTIGEIHDTLMKIGLAYSYQSLRQLLYHNPRFIALQHHGVWRHAKANIWSVRGWL